jgi:hypothetical protein
MTPSAELGSLPFLRTDCKIQHSRKCLEMQDARCKMIPVTVLSNKLVPLSTTLMVCSVFVGLEGCIDNCALTAGLG